MQLILIAVQSTQSKTNKTPLNCFSWCYTLNVPGLDEYLQAAFLCILLINPITRICTRLAFVFNELALDFCCTRLSYGDTL